MKNLAKSILNYYATYTETGFRFAGSSKYKWLESEMCLDLSIFAEFSSIILSNIHKGKLPPIFIKSKEFSISFNNELLKRLTQAALEEKYNESFFISCIGKATKEHENKVRTFIASPDAKIQEQKISSKDEKLIFSQAVEIFAQSFKDYFKDIIANASDETKHDLKKNNQISKFPSSAYSLATTLSRLKNDLILIGEETNEPSEFMSKAHEYFQKDLDLTLFDLNFSLLSYSPFMRAGSSPTTYLYFHSIGTENEKYPLFFIETSIEQNDDGVTISFPRDFMYINTQAINHFELGDVLTLPRSFPITQAKEYILALQHYLQVRFKTADNFIFEPQFQKLVSDTKTDISIEPRVGFCTVSEEDRKLLDYSEILSNVDRGAEQGFTTFIEQCLTGNKANYQEEIDGKFKSEYPIQSPKRFYSQSPLPLNDSQKRILLALQKQENKIIVVDGPPGTGKSHTISAITYWANENKKSIVLTSYKEQALDVLERMLEDRFSTIHPNIKPTILRFSQDTTSENTLHQKLQPASIASANDRTLEFPKEAVSSDITRHKVELEYILNNKLQESKHYEERVKALMEYEISKTALSDKFHISEAVFTQISRNNEGRQISLEAIKSATALTKLKNISLTELQFAINNYTAIPTLLEACEIISQKGAHIPKNIDPNTPLVPIAQSIRSDIEYISSHIKPDILLRDVHPNKHKNGSFIKKIFTKIDSERIINALKLLISLKGRETLDCISRLMQKEVGSMTVSDLSRGMNYYDILSAVQTAYTSLKPYFISQQSKVVGIAQTYDRLKLLQTVTESIPVVVVEDINNIFEKYDTVLAALGITSKDLSSIYRIFEGADYSTYLLSFIKSHEALESIDATQNQTIESLKSEYSTSIHKLIENENAERFKTLNHHLNDISKIKQTYEAGQRLTLDHARILLDAFSCIISEPTLISRFFPMEEELIDVLVIDEASQVSIADALSLILRAKQVVIFGDEYQYGAVKATNASTLYTSGYYKEIIDSFKKDLAPHMTANEEKELIAHATEVQSEDEEIYTLPARDGENAIRWLEVFKIRVSALVFCRALANYSASLKEHFRSYPEIISYSNEFFYKKNQLELIPNRIRTKPIKETLVLMKVETKGFAGQNINLDEIEAIAKDIQSRIDAGYSGTIGIITSFREQQRKMEEHLRKNFDYHLLTKKHKLAVWFVRDVQGEERDLVYYSFVQDDKFPNAELSSIYPVPGGAADTPRSIKMQQLNVGFSRAKDIMIFVHSMTLDKYSKTRLGDALQHYFKLFEETYTREKDMVVDAAVFESPMEREMYMLITNTDFYKKNQDNIRIIPQFNIGKYIKAEYQKYIPNYRADLLLALTKSGKEHPLIVEYDGVEYHFKNPQDVDKYSFSQEYLDYDVARQLELESYGYKFLRINKFILEPRKDISTKVQVMNKLLIESFAHSYS